MDGIQNKDKKLSFGIQNYQFNANSRNFCDSVSTKNVFSFYIITSEIENSFRSVYSSMAMRPHSY